MPRPDYRGMTESELAGTDFGNRDIGSMGEVDRSVLNEILERGGVDTSRGLDGRETLKEILERTRSGRRTSHDGRF